MPELANPETPNAVRDHSSHGYSSFVLKLVAIITMTCNHAGYIYYAHLPFAARVILIAVGGITFPIMAYMLVEGYKYTSSITRYAGRLAIFALISQVPFWLFLGHEGNVLFSLLAGLGILWASDNIENPVLRVVAMVLYGSEVIELSGTTSRSGE